MQVNFPMCTLADIPRTPAHCVEWAKQLEWDRYGKACAPPALELALLLQIPLAYQPFMLQEKRLSGAIETEGLFARRDCTALSIRISLVHVGAEVECG